MSGGLLTILAYHCAKASISNALTILYNWAAPTPHQSAEVQAFPISQLMEQDITASNNSEFYFKG